MKYRLAKLTSDVFNPFLLGFIVITLLSFDNAASAAAGLKWAGISLAVSVVPVLLAVMLMVRLKKLDGMFVNPRRQRIWIYVSATLVSAIGLAVMWMLDAPQLLRTLFVSGLSAILAFMIINFFWKISLHTAFVAGAATVMTLVYGAPGALTLLLLLAVGWARLELKQHTLAQVTVGAVCSAGITAAAFWASGSLS